MITQHYPYKYKYRNTYINMNMRPQHITITSIKYLISYPINMKVSNQVFTTSNSNKCVGGLCLCMCMLTRAHTNMNKQTFKVKRRVSVSEESMLIWEVKCVKGVRKEMLTFLLPLYTTLPLPKHQTTTHVNIKFITLNLSCLCVYVGARATTLTMYTHQH